MKQIHDIELTTSHSVRLIRPCAHCNGTGMRDAMVESGYSGQPHDSTFTAAGTPTKYLFHPQCFIAKFGFRKVTKLPKLERGKFRMKDLKVRQMQRLMDLA
jgi:hypothetical protein